jgi:orotidine-5'-phosphate decarboxylase
LPEGLLKGEPLPDAALRFCLEIVEATRDYACAFKLNFAFFEAMGTEGWRVLQQVVSAIPDSRLKIADAKRGDIGNTGRFYAESILDRLGFDACTVSPYMGRSSVEPFIRYRGKSAFVLALTSNADAREIQGWPTPDAPLHRHVALSATEWGRGQPGEVGLVVGAKDPAGMATIRQVCPTTTLLVPGVGAQGGDLGKVMTAGLTPDGALIINSSRGILYASSDSDYAVAAETAARSLHAEINAARG